MSDNRSKEPHITKKLDEIDEFYTNIELFYPAKQVGFFEDLVVYLFNSRISDEDVIELSKLLLFYLYNVHNYKFVDKIFIKVHEIVRKYHTNESTMYQDLLKKLRIKAMTISCLLPHECKLYFCGLERFMMKIFFYFNIFD